MSRLWFDKDQLAYRRSRSGVEVAVSNGTSKQVDGNSDPYSAFRTPMRSADELRRLEEIVANVLQNREEFFNRFAGGSGGPRTDPFWVDGEVGWPNAVMVDLLRSLYDRNAIANRVVKLY